MARILRVQKGCTRLRIDWLSKHAGYLVMLNEQTDINIDELVARAFCRGYWLEPVSCYRKGMLSGNPDTAESWNTAYSRFEPDDRYGEILVYLRNKDKRTARIRYHEQQDPIPLDDARWYLHRFIERGARIMKDFTGRDFRDAYETLESLALKTRGGQLRLDELPEPYHPIPWGMFPVNLERLKATHVEIIESLRTMGVPQCFIPRYRADG